MSETNVYHNPILPGFYPDPSVCRVGDDFYLVNSSFAYFPGLPVFHSRDLVHWEQIGNAIDRSSQLPLEGAGHSRGLFAPTIRHSEGRFYIACTNVDHGGNFIVTSVNPAGPWSEPHWLRDAPGIDPSLFFDGDGRVWYCGTRSAPEGEKYGGNWEVWLRELDPATLSLKGDAYPLWRGALRDCIWPEGPHIYKRGPWYYLTIAEGGTGLNHAVSVARSRDLTGPWTGNPNNPILTHRNLGRDFPIVNVGHGDLVEDPSGDWWMVLLASRPYGGQYQNMGRETFLVPVIWEDDWPLPCPLSGKVEETFPHPRLPRFDFEPVPACEHFSDPVLAFHWLSLREKAENFSSLSERPGYLRLKANAASMRDRGAASFIGRRQTDRDWSVRTEMEFSPGTAGEAAGLVLLQSNDFQYRLELVGTPGGNAVRLVCAEGKEDRTLAERPYGTGKIFLSAEARGQDLAFRFGTRPGALELFASGVDGRILSTERAGGFVGTVIGMFATGGGRASPNAADFAWFEYRAL